MRAWRSDNARGPGPTAWPLLIWLDDTTIVGLDQADDASFDVNSQRLHLVEHFSRQLSCGDASSVGDYLNVTLTWNVFGNSDVVVARLERGLVRGASGASVAPSVVVHDQERTKSEFSTSVVDTVSCRLVVAADASAAPEYVLQNVRSDQDASTCQSFSSAMFWSAAQAGQGIELLGRTKSECIGVGVNPQLAPEVTPNVLIYSDDTSVRANGFEIASCSPCTGDQTGAWLAYSGDVPPATTTYFVFSYTPQLDAGTDVGQLIHSLELQAGL